MIEGGGSVVHVPEAITEEMRDARQLRMGAIQLVSELYRTLGWNESDRHVDCNGSK